MQWPAACRTDVNNFHNLTPLNEANALGLAWSFQLRIPKRKLQRSAFVRCNSGPDLEAISDGKRGFVGKAEGARVQRTQLEIGRFVSQTAELSSEIEVGRHGNFKATAV